MVAETVKTIYENKSSGVDETSSRTQDRANEFMYACIYMYNYIIGINVLS